MRRLFIPLAAMLLVITSCKKENTNFGNLIGYVSVFDENGDESDNLNGVKVKAKKHEATTNADGKFVLEDLTALYNYDIEFSRSDIKKYTEYGGVVIAGDNFAGDFTLYATPSAVIDFIEYEIDTVFKKVKFNAHVANRAAIDSINLKVYITLSTEEDYHDISNIISDELTTKYFKDDTDTISHTVSGFNLRDIDDNTTVYLTMRIGNSAGSTYSLSYDDYSVNRRYYTGVSAEKTISFIYKEKELMYQ